MSRTTLNEVVVPDTAVSAAAREVASAYLSPGLFNHFVRAYLWQPPAAPLALSLSTRNCSMWRRCFTTSA
ncbi:hypothetical protein ACFO3J_18355 [Streptomyces polygonati]|uniref:Uncharacterized protein n=1 Tax=Streptomyces polygonati TaxID=1617087 RepID=A0ABV8HN34_9ACTN